MDKMIKHLAGVLLFGSVVTLALPGCEFIVDFDRSQIDSGATDSGATDAHDSGTDGVVADGGGDADAAAPDGGGDTGADSGAGDTGADSGAGDTGADSGAGDTGADSGAGDTGADSGADTGGLCAGVDCTGMDGECVVGVCSPATGACGAMPRPMGTACNDAFACTTADTCDAAGVCQSGAVTVGCLIGGACTAEAALDPGNDCMSCQNAASSTGYSPVTMGTACSDGLSCTTDACDAAGACQGTVSAGCLIGGACIAEAVLDPGNDCMSCQSATSTTAYTAVPDATSCSDGLTCTTPDTCTGGTCGGVDNCVAATCTGPAPGSCI